MSMLNISKLWLLECIYRYEASHMYRNIYFEVDFNNLI